VNEQVPPKRIDPALLHQLDSAEKDQAEVQAVFYLRSPDPAKELVDPEEAESLANSVLQRVEQETKTQARDTHLLRNLGSLVVVAPAAFIRKLIEQDEIAAAIANRQEQR
jgi:hypothetical protein